MEKRMILAIALSLLVLLVFQSLRPGKALYHQPQPPASPPMQTKAQVFAEKGEQTAEKPEGEKEPLQENVTEVETEKYRLSFSDIGGSLKALSLKEFGEKEGGEELFDVEAPAERLFALQSEISPDLQRRRFKIAAKGEGFLEYRLIDPGWVEVTKRYTFHKALDYITLDVLIKNLSPRKMVFSYQIKGPSRLRKTSQVLGRSFLEADTMIDGKIWKTKSVKGIQERSGGISWTALKNRYFTLLLRPFDLPKSVRIQSSTDKDILTALQSRNYELPPGGEVEARYLLYAGPLDEKKIAALGDDMHYIVDYGFFGGLSKMLLSILRFFQKGTKNWGIAIILLTILINFILFPLTFKSFVSMQQMKKIQPHIQKLKEIHKDNPQRLNKEMMEVYRKYNVNPFGGCLPMLLQMPIFISLYQGLMRSVALKGAKFLWIKDLARPDAVALPFSLPFIGNHINILPLLMVGVMVLQQKLTQGRISAGTMTEEQLSQQRMMMLLMPLLFGFLFYKMPSGLVLYWLTNTVLMTAEQTIISRRVNGR